jgi:UDP-N-acetylglucosamine diphosphorylase / glucose-1-phosphate thymidylyltransferase / UDP-N-acetylgalactosamine diphosphorylase / glucosamine-1-phosphate N-acetyltransferase / galactosamine-1-phosphate N-acetyltransferase
MKAVILAAGKGTRMRGLTQDLPKPMLEVQGKPVLEWIIERLAQSGISDFCIITGYLAEKIEQHFNQGDSWGARICYARQEVQNGTGKAPELARQFVGADDFLLTYGDILVPAAAYQSVQNRFKEGDFAGVLTVTPGEDPSRGGLNFFDENFCLRKIVEKPGPEELDRLRNEGWGRQGETLWYNAGVYLFQPLLFRYTERLEKSPRGEYELPDALNAMIMDGLKIAGCAIQRQDWEDVRDPEILEQLQRRLK